MIVKLTQIPPKEFVGLFMPMSMNNFKPAVLFRQFMPLIKGIEGRLNNSIFDINIWPGSIIDEGFSPNLEFIKWASVQVKDGTQVIDPIKKLKVGGGLYATFEHHGSSRNINQTMQTFFEKWLPSSKYTLDDRPHIYEMDERYKGPDDENSIEIISIPLKQ